MRHRHKKSPRLWAQSQGAGDNGGGGYLSLGYHNAPQNASPSITAIYRQAARLATAAPTPELRHKHRQLAAYLAAYLAGYRGAGQ